MDRVSQERPMSLLLEAQMFFCLDVARLIQFIASQGGYGVTMGWAYRPPEYAMVYVALKKGVAHSIHEDRLGIDLQLFLDGVYLTESSEYAPLGDYWKSLRPENRWGGDFERIDGNHFSREWDGRA